jgi:hypothetical protein
MMNETTAHEGDALQVSPPHLIKDLPHIRLDKFLSTYINSTGLATNFYDLTVIFGKVTVSDAGEPVVEDHAAITMSWEHAKALATGLKQAVDNYEQNLQVKVRDLAK